MGWLLAADLARLYPFAKDLASKLEGFGVGEK